MIDPLRSGRAMQILLVDDNEDDVFLTREAFSAANFLVNLHHVDNGEKCMAFLRKKPPYADAPTPDVILLDLNMPIMDGREVLAAIIKDEALKHLAVVILTTSSAEADILEMYRLRCSSYIIKPVGFKNFVEVVRKLGNYWLTMVVMPKIST